jgi:uncharacterized membrane protein (DUF485 family)
MSLEQQIGNVLSQSSTLNQNLTPIIGRESEIKTITDRELSRLNAKKIEVDDAYNTNKRFVDLNDSYRKKQSQYNYLMFVVISFFVVMIIMMQIQKAVPAIGGLLTFIIVILGIVVFGYGLYIIYDIYRRDPNDFEKINYAPPPGVDEVVIDPATGKASTVSKGLINPETGKKYDPSTSASMSRKTGLSAGQDACFKDQNYDYYSGKCLPQCATNAKFRNMTGYIDSNTKKLDYKQIDTIASTHNDYCIDVCPATTKTCGKFCIPKEYTCGAASESFTTLGNSVSPNSPNEFSNYSPL